ncbi:transposase family protein [Luteolibacter flavescens]|uniref:Transposase family protein n=1 Tax=Luteolibacter flavescens TaxID=1859460 RepID=A0ABT3FIU2_9BACT|nr:transposase family protein [Luteolibacter flavescens]MCW1883481.1 transposase family protein [Luteolibacter flavescens]
MSQSTTREYTEKMRGRYARMTGKTARSRLLDEYVVVTGFERKYAIKVLGGSRRVSGTNRRRGAPKRYDGEVVGRLRELWLVMEQPCGKRMKDMLPLWLGHCADKPGLKKRLLSMGAATIDRCLAASKVAGPKKRLPPRSDAAIKALVEIRAGSWEVGEAGWTEVDTVAHCGGDMGGSFIWSLTSVEILSGWTEVRAIWNRGQHATLEGMKAIEAAQPFDLKGVDSDNGGEFLNHHLHGWLKGRGIKQTRSRPYRKNDQAHVEQKNHTHVRQLLGHDRLGHEELVDPLNELLSLWCLWKNLYSVTMEQVSKRREGSKEIRRHAKKSRTPAERLVSCGKIALERKIWLAAQRRMNNPFEMKAGIERMLAAIWELKERLDGEEDGCFPLRVPGFLRYAPSPLAPARGSTLNQAATVSA